MANNRRKEKKPWESGVEHPASKQASYETLLDLVHLLARQAAREMFEQKKVS